MPELCFQITLKALANFSPGLLQPWDSSSNHITRELLKEFVRSLVSQSPTLSA